MVSVLPFNVAVADPEPAIVDCIAMSSGTSDSRARYCGACA